MQHFSTLFGKELYMFRADLLLIIGSLNTVLKKIGICHTSYVACLLTRLGWKNIRITMHSPLNVKNIGDNMFAY